MQDQRTRLKVMANQHIPRSGRRLSNPCSRHFLFLLLFLIVSLFFISVVPASAGDSQFRANPEHTGMYDNRGSEPGNTELWRFATGGIVYSSPAVANGIVYVGSEDKNLYAIDTVTGKEKWRFATGDHIFSSPTVANGIVYIGSEDKNLYAIDAVTGKERWRFAMGGWVYSVSSGGERYCLCRECLRKPVRSQGCQRKPARNRCSNGKREVAVRYRKLRGSITGSGERHRLYREWR